ncbi:acyltransferase [Candidatus Poribacteria bacterium]
MQRRKMINYILDSTLRLFIHLEPRLRWKYYNLRNQMIVQKMQSCGTGCMLHGKVTIVYPEHLSLGNNVHIGNNALIDALGGVTIGDNTHISRNLTIYSCNHNYEGKVLPYDSISIRKPIAIGRNVWIGADVKVIPGVAIGDGAIIGMGVVVSKDVPPLAVVVGQPFRIIKYRDKQRYSKLEESALYGGVNGLPLRQSEERNEQPH